PKRCAAMLVDAAAFGNAMPSRNCSEQSRDRRSSPAALQTAGSVVLTQPRTRHDQRCHTGTSIAKWAFSRLNFGLCRSSIGSVGGDAALLSQVRAFSPQPAGNNLAG